MIFANVHELQRGRRKTRPQTQRRPTARPLAGGEVVVAVVGPYPREGGGKNENFIGLLSYTWGPISATLIADAGSAIRTRRRGARGADTTCVFSIFCNVWLFIGKLWEAHSWLYRCRFLQINSKYQNPLDSQISWDFSTTIVDSESIFPEFLFSKS